MRKTCCIVTALASGTALGQTATDLIVQESQSSVSAEICLTPPGLGTRCDTDDSSVHGFLAIELDSYDTPTAITLHNFTLALTENLSYNMDWGFFIGGLNIDLSGVLVSYATPGTPTGPVPVDGAGDFAFPVVQALIEGTGSYEGYGPIIGTLIGSGVFSLADFGVVDSAIAGNVLVGGAQVTLSGGQAFYQEGEIEGVEASIDGSAAILAIGDVPETCRVDINDDGTVNTQDFIAYLNLWTSGNPQADFNSDGAVNTQDFLVFLNEWVTGC